MNPIYWWQKLAKMTNLFEGSSCVREFLDWLEELTEEDTRMVTVIAHNFQGYDGFFCRTRLLRTESIDSATQKWCQVVRGQT